MAVKRFRRLAGNSSIVLEVSQQKKKRERRRRRRPKERPLLPFVPRRGPPWGLPVPWTRAHV
jgi:hypothetical protein